MKKVANILPEQQAASPYAGIAAERCAKLTICGVIDETDRSGEPTSLFDKPAPLPAELGLEQR